MCVCVCVCVCLRKAHSWRDGSSRESATQALIISCHSLVLSLVHSREGREIQSAEVGGEGHGWWGSQHAVTGFELDLGWLWNLSIEKGKRRGLENSLFKATAMERTRNVWSPSSLLLTLLRGQGRGRGGGGWGCCLVFFLPCLEIHILFSQGRCSFLHFGGKAGHWRCAETGGYMPPL